MIIQRIFAAFYKNPPSDITGVHTVHKERLFGKNAASKKFVGQGINIHRKKKVREFPVPSRDVTTKLSLGGNNDVITELFLTRGSLVSDIPAGDGKLVNLFLRCIATVW
jgi:hypothetical protein